jgi:hypothetical protein
MRSSKAIMLTLLTLIVAGCTEGERSNSGAGQTKSTDQDVVRAVAQPENKWISAGDLEAIAMFVELPSRWNRAAAPLVRDYLDPNVSADRWVREASGYMGELRAVHVEMQATLLAMQDPGVKKTFDEIASNYRTKLDCLTALHFAVAQGDQQAEQRAQEVLSEASAEGQRLAQSLLHRLTPYVDPQLLIRELSKRGKEIGALMKPQ